MNIGNTTQAQQNELTPTSTDALNRRQDWAHAVTASLKKRFGGERITIEQFLSIFGDNEDDQSEEDVD